MTKKTAAYLRDANKCLKAALLTLISFQACAEDAWFATGPLLANSSLTVPANHLSTDFYQYYLVNEGEYLRHPQVTSTSADISNTSILEAALGLTTFLDVQMTANFNHNVSKGAKTDSIGDTNLLFGLQLFKQENNPYMPNVRLTIQETFPTGRYNNLNPLANGTDSSGLGSYQTNFGVSFGYLAEPFIGHYLQATLNLNFLLPQSTMLFAHNTYGGTSQTRGLVNPGDLRSLDFALEFSLTKNVALVLETYMSSREAERFNGLVGFHSDGRRGSIGDGLPNTQYTLAPAVEISVSENFGIIGSWWYSLGGNNSSVFYAPALGISYQS